MVVDNGWSGVAFGKDGTVCQNRCFFKKVGYQLNPALTRPNQVVHSIWMYNDPNRGAPQLKGEFTWHPKMDIAGEGDVMNDNTWHKNGLTVEHLKAYVESRDWTAVTVANNDHAFYKHVPYCLKPD